MLALLSRFIKIKDLDTIFATVCAPGGPSQNPVNLVSDLITKEADACLTADTGVNFENKIVLAIATRLAAERFMIGKINDPAFVNAISSDQTPTLITRFRKDFPELVSQ